MEDRRNYLDTNCL